MMILVIIVAMMMYNVDERDQNLTNLGSRWGQNGTILGVKNPGGFSKIRGGFKSETPPDFGGAKNEKNTYLLWFLFRQWPVLRFQINITNPGGFHPTHVLPTIFIDFIFH